MIERLSSFTYNADAGANILSEFCTQVNYCRLRVILISSEIPFDLQSDDPTRFSFKH